MKLVQLIFKNSSTLDFTLPIYWSLNSQSENHKFIIFYWSLTKEEKVFVSPYTTEFMRENHIQEMTLSDFPKTGLKWPIKVCAFFAKKFLPPSTPLREALQDFQWQAIKENIFFRLFRPVRKLVEKYAVDYKKLFHTLNYDILFYDNRSRIENIDIHALKDWMDKTNKIVVLTPHAPHYIRETEGFAPLIPNLVDLTDYCQVWYTHKLSRPWISYEQFSRAFHLSGYTGFDSTWLEYIKNNTSNQPRGEVINVLIPGRKFYGKKIKKRDANEFVTQTYEEALEFINQAYSALKEASSDKNRKFHLIYKPHPSSQLSLVQQLILESKFESAEIFTDLVYFTLARIDLVITPYTTLLLIPCFAEIPVILINSKLQEQINSYWDKVEQMYQGLEYFSKDPSALVENCRKVLARLEKGETSDHDKKFLSQYFPESSLEMINRILSLS